MRILCCIFLATYLSTAEERPTLTKIMVVAPDTLAIEISAQHRIGGEQQVYQQQADDHIKVSGHNRWLVRDGQTVGALIHNDQLLMTFDQISGQALHTESATRLKSWRIQEQDQDIPIVNIYRKSKATDTVRTGPWNFKHPQSHVLYLQCAQELATGKRYTITCSDNLLKENVVHFTHRPDNNVTEIIHVNHLGFHPKDPYKVAYVSLWMGDGGAYHFGKSINWSLLDDASNLIHSSHAKISHAKNSPDAGREKTNNVHADVYALDFSHIKNPGKYRIKIDNIGVSNWFYINDTVYRKAWQCSASGFYHQRSGIALEKPFTSWLRPRNMHPQDKVSITQSSANIVESTSQKHSFTLLKQGQTQKQRKNAWGGYHDAGDWDRRALHLDASDKQLELLILFPEHFHDTELSIPERNNSLPDILDEALWNIDCYRRMQGPNGGIPHGIESEAHPKFGEKSWQESLPIMVFAEDVLSTYRYVNSASAAAYVLRPINQTLAQTYIQSAHKGLLWAEQHVNNGTALGSIEGKHRDKQQAQLRNVRARALISYYRYTEDKKWHDLFADITAIKKNTPLFKWQVQDAEDEAFSYATLPEKLILSNSLKDIAIENIYTEANHAVGYGMRTSFGWASADYGKHLGWGLLTSPTNSCLVRSHFLSKDKKYLKALIRSMQYTMGANPVNMCFTTGLGYNYPRNPLIIDARVSNREPPPGITVYGPFFMPSHAETNWSMKLLKNCTYPALKLWPSCEAYFDVYLSPSTNEFTIMQSMGPVFYAWAYLDATHSHND